MLLLICRMAAADIMQVYGKTTAAPFAAAASTNYGVSTLLKSQGINFYPGIVIMVEKSKTIF